MTDDDRLAALGRLAREEESVNELEERLERLTHGQLSRSEMAQLEREAEPETLQAYRPLPSDFKDQVANRLEPLLPPEKKPATVTPLPTRPRWVMPAAVAALVAAAAAIFLFLSPSPTRSALPGYELALSGGVREVRSSTPEPITLAPGSSLTLVARPTTATKERVVAYVFAGPDHAPVKAEAENSADGAIRLIVAEADLPPSDHETTLSLLVGREDVVTAPEAARTLLAHGSGPGYQILTATVRRQR
jgi:hypothetical protein